MANAFRATFRAQMPEGRPDAELELSLLNYSRPDHPSTLAADAADIGDSHLVGIGAIGNGALWALFRHRGLTGRPHLVDGQKIETSNLQRYVMAHQRDVGSWKVDAAVALERGAGLAVEQHRANWAEYVSDRNNWHFESVAVALDTAWDRIAVQAAPPGWIVNAWTQDIDLGVSRHRFGDGRACLACLYMPTGQVKNEHERMAEELRMPEAVEEIKRMLQVGATVDGAFLTRVATALGIPDAPLKGPGTRR